MNSFFYYSYVPRAQQRFIFPAVPLEEERLTDVTESEQFFFAVKSVLTHLCLLGVIWIVTASVIITKIVVVDCLHPTMWHRELQR